MSETVESPTTTPIEQVVPLVVTINQWYADRKAKLQHSGSNQTAIASETTLRQDWDNSQEDAAWSTLERELIAEAEHISAAIEKDPSTLVSHAELKRRLAEKKAYVASQALIKPIT